MIKLQSFEYTHPSMVRSISCHRMKPNSGSQSRLDLFNSTIKFRQSRYRNAILALIILPVSLSGNFSTYDGLFFELSSTNPTK